MITKLNFTDHTIKSYAIRKLTPPECFRLMGVRQDVINVMQITNAQAAERMPGTEGKGKPTDMAVSVSQQYKQAGNSICVDVLKHVYSQLWYPQPPKPQAQLSMLDAFFPEDALPSMPVDTNEGEKVIITTFSGYDSQLMAADALREDHPNFRWTCMGWSDIDKYACQMHNIVFPQYADRALGDITKIDWHKVKQSLQGREVDLFTYSSPCQDISQAGKQMGLKEGSDTRSALLWHVADAVAVLKPKYLLQENVAALVSEKFMPDFKLWLAKLESLGYVNRWARLNAKDYGVPQNRDRVFCLSMRKDVAFDYQFPEAIPLQTRLEDVLDEEVSERYFLKDDAVRKFLQANDTDTALFLQFDLPPTHEAAMFLKTWLTLWMQAADGWEMTSTSLQLALYSAKQEMELSYSVFNEKGASALGEKFASLYKENMERNPNT